MIALPVLALVYLIGLLAIGVGEAALLWLQLVPRTEWAEDILDLPKLPDIIAKAGARLARLLKAIWP